MGNCFIIWLLGILLVSYNFELGQYTANSLFTAWSIFIFLFYYISDCGSYLWNIPIIDFIKAKKNLPNLRYSNNYWFLKLYKGNIFFKPNYLVIKDEDFKSLIQSSVDELLSLTTAGNTKVFDEKNFMEPPILKERSEYSSNDEWGKAYYDHWGAVSNTDPRRWGSFKWEKFIELYASKLRKEMSFLSFVTFQNNICLEDAEARNMADLFLNLYGTFVNRSIVIEDGEVTGPIKKSKITSLRNNSFSLSNPYTHIMDIDSITRLEGNYRDFRISLVDGSYFDFKFNEWSCVIDTRTRRIYEEIEELQKKIDDLKRKSDS